MPHNGKHEYDELAANPECAFQPARHPNARERKSIQQHDAHFRRATRDAPQLSVPALRTAPEALAILTGTLLTEPQTRSLTLY